MNQIRQSTKRWFAINYPWLGTEETLVSAQAEVETEDANAADAADPLFKVHLVEVEPATKQVKFLAGGAGIEGNIYHVKISVVTSTQQETTDCLKFVITGDC